MAFRKKAALLLAHQPDILVIPECERPDKLLFSSDIPQPADTLWFGNNPHKGLGIFSYGNFRLRLLEGHNADFRMIIPIAIQAADAEYYLFAIWANNPADRDGQYVAQVWKAIHHYSGLLDHSHCILAGDFNSNTIWDKPRRAITHSKLVAALAEKGIHSTYHLRHAQAHGTEMAPTHYLYRHRDKPYHLDYCFASQGLLNQLRSVEIGEYDSWRPYSDHMPIIVDFDIKH